MIDRIISHYKVTAQIGAGGMGIVYEAEDLTLKRRVAIKTLKDVTLHGARLLREAQAVSNIVHPNVAAIYDYGETEEGQPYIVMELVQGVPLDQFIRNNRLSLFQIIEVIIKVAEALAAAHAQGIVHRDIKPTNILIKSDHSLKVLDFGLSKLVKKTRDSSGTETAGDADATQTQDGMILGTPLYLSPEQASGVNVDERSDIFSVGTLLYESITGSSPFKAASVIETCAKILRDDPSPPSNLNSTIPAALDELTLKALAKEPKDRYQSAEALIADLRDLQKDVSNAEIASPNRIPDTAHSISERLRISFVDVMRRPYLKYLVFATMFIAGISAILYWQAGGSYKSKPEAQKWYTDGVRAFNDGAFDSARKCFEEAIMRDGTSVMAYARHAETLRELGYVEKAKNERERANNAASRNESPLSAEDQVRLRAINSTLLSEFPSAIKDYKELTGLPESDKVQAFLDLGRAYERNENQEEAIKSYQKALEINPDLPAAYVRLGVLSGRRLEREQSTPYFAEAERLYGIQNNPEGAIEISYQRSLLLSITDDATKAKDEAEKALQKAEILGIPYQRVRCWLLMSRILRSSPGNQKDAFPYVEEAISLSKQIDINDLQAQSFLERGTVNLILKKFPDSKNDYDEALRLARQYDMTVLENRVLLQLGAFYVYQHLSTKALTYADQVQPFFERGGYKRDMLDVLSIKAQAQKVNGEFRAALDLFRDLEKRASEVNDPLQKARALKGVGDMLVNTDQFSAALGPMQESYAVYNSINRRYEAGHSLIAYADIFCQIGRYKEADASLNQAEGFEDKRLIPRIRLVRLKEALSQRRFADAIETAQMIIVDDKDGKSEVTVESKLILALAQVGAGQVSSATNTMSEIFPNAIKNEDHRIVAYAHLANSEVLLENGQFAEAFENATKAQEMYHGFEKTSLEWRAWLSIARAQRGFKEDHKASAAKSDAAFSTLYQKLVAADLHAYSNRSDVKAYRRLLLELSARH